jgi:alpha-mannosidase
MLKSWLKMHLLVCNQAGNFGGRIFLLNFRPRRIINDYLGSFMNWEESMSINRWRSSILCSVGALILAVAAVLILGGSVAFAGALSASGGTASPADQAKARRPTAGTPAPAPDLTKQPTLYTVGYAHLDTQWRWDYVTTINEYIPATMRLNFALFEKYPHYVFNFSGANRYRMMKEYYPADYERVKKYVAAGRWFPCGSSMEENDVNATSAESIIRQVLYGTHYFRREFGFTSAEYMLPDCFGFPASLPSILAHCGLKGFSTQKLVWGSFALVGGPNSAERTPVGIPFNVGIWEGPDGQSVVAALNPGDYGGSITYDLSGTPPPPPQASEGRRRRMRPEIDWPARLDLDGRASGLFADYMYYGTGDIGGSPTEASVKLLEEIVTGKDGMGAGPVHVIPAKADRMFLDITAAGAERLPRYKGDLELTNHSAGSITSQAYMKRWNRWNEVLADDAERASLAAEWLGGRAYPLPRLNAAWTLVMGGQFHDILPGTSIPKAYEYSWNDEVLAMNQFAGVLADAAGAAASVLDTRVKGIAVVVYNPLNVEREDIVEAAVEFSGGEPKAVRVLGPDGMEVPAQISGGRVIFPAKVPSVGFAVYDVQSAETAAGVASDLKVSESSLENARYRVALDENGDVSSIFDKALGKELLYSPARLEIKTDIPHDWPAWNMDWADQSRPARAHVRGPAKSRIVETGPARVAVEIAREAEGSRFVQTIRLAAGDAGNRVEFRNAIDWMTKAAHLKAVFPLTAQNAVATYNWDIGTIERSTDNPKDFEFPSHQWIDLTDESGSFGATVLSDAKYGSDKPDDNTIRLTLIRTPGIGAGNGRDYADQTTQDWGRHEFVYGLAGHAGDFRQEQTDWQGFRLNQPLRAFQSPAHEGALGKSFSLMGVDNGRVRALALKKAEQSDEVVLRLVEMDGRPAKGIAVRFAAPITAAREVTGAETPVGEATVTDGVLVLDFSPFQVRTFAFKLGPSPAKAGVPLSQPVTLRYDRQVVSRDRTKVKGGFDGRDRCLAAEMLPAEIPYAGIRFRLGSPDKPDAVAARGQTINLPKGKFTRLYILAASGDGDRKAAFRVGDAASEFTVQDWGGYIGQWDNRTWKTHEEPVPRRPGQPAPAPGEKPRMRTVMDYEGLKPGYIKPSPVAWFASHRHSAAGENEPYSYSYLFAYTMDIPAGATTLTLPNDEKINILAVTVANESDGVRPAQPLMDTLGQ